MEKYSYEHDPLSIDTVDTQILRVLSQEADLSYVELMKRRGIFYGCDKISDEKTEEDL